VKKVPFYIWVSLLILAVIYIANLLWYKPFTVSEFYERTLFRIGLRHPEMLTAYGLLKPYGLSFYENRLDDLSDDASNEEFKQIFRDLEMLYSYKRSKQSPDELLSTEVMGRYLENQSLAQPFIYCNYPINPIDGQHLYLPSFMVLHHQISSYADAVHYIERLATFKTRMAQCIEGLDLRRGYGYVPPKYMLNKVLAQLEEFTGTAPTDNVMYRDFAAKIETVENLPAESKEELLLDAAAAIEEVVFPAYSALADYLKILGEEAADTDSLGAWQFDEDNRYYSYLLRRQTSLDSLTPEFVHRTALHQADSLQKLIHGLLDSLQYPQAPLAERLRAFVAKEEKRTLISTQDANYFTDYLRVFTDTATRFAQAIGLPMPQSSIYLKQMPLSVDKLIHFHIYSPPIPEVNRSAAYLLNLSQPSPFRQLTARALVFAEVAPGRHWQFALQREANNFPTFRKIWVFNAFTEGWPLFVLRLAQEKGYFRTPYERVGLWCYRLQQVCRMACDTGIHHKRWRRAAAIRFLEQQAAMPAAEAEITADAIVVNPAFAVAGFAGETGIVYLRELFRQQHPKAKNDQQFYQQLLSKGSLPLDILFRQFQPKTKEH
jgi:uncharacterized protein (DUF885 family)